MRRRPTVLTRPPQGWSSLLLFLGMLLVVGLSIADARPLDVGGQDRTGSLIVVMIAAGLIGFTLARSSLGIVRSHLLGAAAGAFVLLSIVAAAALEARGVLPGGIGEFADQLRLFGALLEADVERWLEVPDFVPLTATLLVLGAIAWTTGQFGAFSIFRYDRAGPAVMATGLLLFLNVATRALGPERDLLPLIPVLATYSALAMLLLMRLQLGQQSEHWARRHIADATDVGRLFLRTGSLFVAVAVLGASSLTALAVVEPPQIDLDDLDGPLEDLGENVSHWLALFAVPVQRDEPTTFGSDFEVQDTWEPGAGTAFTALVEGGMRDNYWWGAGYDRFDGSTWSQSDLTDFGAEPGELLPIGLAAAGGNVPLEAFITTGDSAFSRGTVLGPAQAEAIDKAVIARTIGRDGSLADITFDDALDQGETYRVNSYGHDYRRRGGSLTANELRAAGRRYPEDIRERYLDIQPGSVGPLVAAKASEIQRRADTDTPYDQALLLQDQLREFDYVERIEGCGGRSVAECLLQTKRGFCQQFATTMVMVLRSMDIPARFVNGFLPGPSEDGVHSVPMAALHSWVEVYFPGHGWVRFDPTPVDNADLLQQAATDFADGPPIDDSRPDIRNVPEETLPPEPEPTEEPDIAAPAQIEEPPARTGGGAMSRIVTLVGLVLLTLLAVGAYVVHRLRRLPGADAALAYRGIVSLATRLGYGPHPSQTEYEYASSLSETIPTVRDDLFLVAGARVESAYGQRTPRGDRLAALRRAYARIRTALLRLTFRRRS